MKKLSEAIIKYRFLIIAAFAALTVLSLIQIRNIEVDPEVKKHASEKYSEQDGYR